LLKVTKLTVAVTQRIQIVASHGGVLDVDSREGHGTAVTVRLPLRAPGGAHTHPTSAGGHHAATA
jgi:nitrogen-specific signal transduction histidine kinase